jgi:dihydropteroate synthase
MFYASPKTKIMAILNVTPDSFSDGGRLETVDAAVRAAEHALAAGAHILDVGGESTRPGAETIDVQAEIQRVVPTIEAILRRFPQAIVSVDTRKSAVADAALQAGAQWINDVSGLQYDALMADVVARNGAHLVLMHSQGTPEMMQQNPQYPQGVMSSLLSFFEQQIAMAMFAGISPERLILDPGFGFGKTVAHNLDLLRELDALHALGLPLLIGTSRKSFLTLGNRDIYVHEREALTAVSLAWAVQKGAAYVRVHDIETHAPVIRLAEALLVDPVESLTMTARSMSLN